jgi:hypothetical protein
VKLCHATEYRKKISKNGKFLNYFNCLTTTDIILYIQLDVFQQMLNSLDEKEKMVVSIPGTFKPRS